MIINGRNGAVNIVENGGFVSGNMSAVTFAPNILSGVDLFASATAHSGTTMTSVTIQPGGRLDVFGGLASSITVSAWNGLFVNSGSAADITVSSGAKMYIGGTASSIIVSSGGSLFVADAGAALHVTSEAGAIITGNGYIEYA